MKKKPTLKEFFKGIACISIMLVVMYILSFKLFTNKDYISQNTYIVHAVSYEYGSIAIDDNGNKYSIIDAPEYPDKTKVVLVLYDLLTKDKSDDVVVFIDEE